MSGGASDKGVAVVTGGSAGLGRAIVRELAARGWDVAVLARGEDGVEGAAQDVRAAGRRALAIPTDVADRRSVDAAADRVEAELGPIRVWINDAMVGVFGEFVSTDPEDFEQAVQVNFFGFVNGTRAALLRMRRHGRGVDRAGRLGAGPPRHPAAGGVLRVEARDHGLHGIGAHGAAARQVDRSRCRRWTCPR